MLSEAKECYKTSDRLPEEGQDRTEKQHFTERLEVWEWLLAVGVC